MQTAGRPRTQQVERGQEFTDEWGVQWVMPQPEGLYFDMVGHPLARCTTAAEIREFRFPNPSDPGRFRGLRAVAESYAADQPRAILIMPPYGGMLEFRFSLHGYTQFLVDLGRSPEIVNAILDKTLEFRLAYWRRALEELGDLVDVVVEYDDVGTTTSTLMSRTMYRKYLKPRHTEPCGYIKSHSHAAVFLHSCGAIYPVIPDFIDAGVRHPESHTGLCDQHG